jgi:hypothetical protein
MKIVNAPKSLKSPLPSFFSQFISPQIPAENRQLGLNSLGSEEEISAEREFLDSAGRGHRDSRFVRQQEKRLLTGRCRRSSQGYELNCEECRLKSDVGHSEGRGRKAFSFFACSTQTPE